jgi:hypothetical protein
MKFCDIASNTSGQYSALRGDYGKIDSDWSLMEYLVTLVAWDIRLSGWAWGQEDCEFVSAGGPVILEIMKLLDLEDYWLGSWIHHTRSISIFITPTRRCRAVWGVHQNAMMRTLGGTLAKKQTRTLRFIVQLLMDRSPPLKRSLILKDDWCGSGFENMAPPRLLLSILRCLHRA